MTPAAELLARLRAAGCHPVLDKNGQVTFPQPIPAEMRPVVAPLGNELRDLLKGERKQARLLKEERE